jgi:hypothetical protein
VERSCFGLGFVVGLIVSRIVRSEGRIPLIAFTRPHMSLLTKVCCRARKNPDAPHGSMLNLDCVNSW